MTKRDNRPTDKVHNHIRGQSFVTLAKIAIAVSAISAITSLQLRVHHHHHLHHYVQLGVHSSQFFDRFL